MLELLASLCVALLAAPPTPAEEPLDFTLVWEDAERSRDASSTETTLVVKGDTLTYRSASSGHRMPVPEETGPKYDQPVKLDAATRDSVRALLAKLAMMKSVDAIPRGYEGDVREVSLKVTSGKRKWTLSVGVIAKDAKQGHEQLALLEQLEQKLLLVVFQAER